MEMSYFLGNTDKFCRLICYCQLYNEKKIPEQKRNYVINPHNQNKMSIYDLGVAYLKFSFSYQ